ncbi:ABC transporter ATP-binding protein [Pedobacter yulinensis]|uniref:ABC transporter ATP-binding protein n=1 Tax=Pedobacter yulinensis TaxID=2126353 RepID=A0A2T3HRN2_9SPHI|nr:ATP-binding cassette domain-containing protein [Pedobacter yulinensis]PST85098.1 ABC transporter ATP-binding protein [Pedobacter yulinensis]
MRISLENAGRRFNREWIFRGVTANLLPGGRYAVLGPNGSGKSTLLSLISGHLSPSEGKVLYQAASGPVQVESVYRHLSFAAPYLDLIEEFSLSEMIDFHFRFKPMDGGMDRHSLVELLGMEKSKHKAIKYFSSGMKQRTRLALACCAATPVLLLDEPTSNLDSQGVQWYEALIEGFAGSKLIVVCSNQPYEYAFCKHYIQITDYK